MGTINNHTGAQEQLTLDREETEALKVFIENVWLLRHAQKELEKNPLSIELAMRRDEYEKLVDDSLKMLVNE